jgi:hypothetical protein
MTAIRRSPEFGSRKCLEAMHARVDELSRSRRHRPRANRAKLPICHKKKGPPGAGTYRQRGRRGAWLAGAEPRVALGVHQTDEQHRDGHGGQAQKREQSYQSAPRIGTAQHVCLPLNTSLRRRISPTASAELFASSTIRAHRSIGSCPELGPQLKPRPMECRDGASRRTNPYGAEFWNRASPTLQYRGSCAPRGGGFAVSAPFLPSTR